MRIWILLAILGGCASDRLVIETSRPIVIRNSRVKITRIITRNEETFKRPETRHEH